MFPLHWKQALQVYTKATSRPYGYLMLDLHPATDDTYRLFTHLLDEEGHTHTYKKHEPQTHT